MAKPDLLIALRPTIAPASALSTFFLSDFIKAQLNVTNITSRQNLISEQKEEKLKQKIYNQN